MNFDHGWLAVWIAAAVVLIGLLCVDRLEKGMDPAGRKDKRYVACAAVLLMIPVVLCAAMAYVFLPGINNHTGRGYGAYGIPRAQITDAAVQRWISDCETKTDETACYGLIFDDGKEKSLLIYVDTEASLQLKEQKDWRGTHRFSLETADGEENQGGYFLQAVMAYQGEVEIAVTIDGKEYPVEFTKIKAPLPQFYE